MADSDRNWFSTSELAKLLNLSARQVRRSSKYDKFRVGYPGKHPAKKRRRFLLPLEMLPYGGLEFIPSPELDKLPPAERQQVIADLRRDAAYIAAAKTPIEQAKRFGERFPLPTAPPQAEHNRGQGYEGKDGGTRRVNTDVPDIAGEIDERANKDQLSRAKDVRDTFRDLVVCVMRRQIEMDKKAAGLRGAEGDHLA